MITVKVIFQGGGARLPTLMAAAEVLAALPDVRVSHVYGVSAGAIAGCMLATKQSMAEYRQKAMRVGAEALAAMPTIPTGLWGLGRRIAWGAPILPQAQLEHFLSGLFTVTDEHNATRVMGMSELLIPVTFYAADLRNQKKIPYTRECGRNVVDILADSCALPYIFRTFTFGGPIVDGGLVGNLPSDDLLFKDDPDTKLLAFGFRDDTTHTPESAVKYGWALVCAAMEASVSDMMSRVELHGGKTCLLPNKYSTTEFERALREGLSDKVYSEAKETISNRLNPIIENWTKRVDPVPEISLEKTDPVPEMSLEKTIEPYDYNPAILRAHKAAHDIYPYRVPVCCTIVTANCLWPTDDPQSQLADMVLQILEVTPLKDSLFTVRVGIAAGQAPVRQEHTNWWVQDAQGRDLSATHMPARELQETPDGNLVIHHSVLVFDRPIEAASCPIKIYHRTDQKNAMLNLRTLGIDWMRTRSSQSRDTDYEDQVLILPQEFGHARPFDLLDSLDDLPEGARPKNLAAMRSNWTNGRPMTPEELKGYRQVVVPSHGAVWVGWRAARIPHGNYAGMAIVAKKRGAD